MTEEEREMDFQLAELRDENAALRRKLNTAAIEIGFLRGCMQQVQTVAARAANFMKGDEHGDKDSY